MRVTRRRRAAARRHRQGHHPRHHRRDRHRRRHRPRHRICRRGDPRALDGRPHDRLQHVDRGRRPRRHDRAGREDLRLSEGPPEGAEGRRLGRGGALLGDAARATRARISTREIRLDAANLPPIVTWGTSPGGRRLGQRRVPEPGRDRGREQAASRSGARSTIWASSRARRSPTSPSTGCSSARAPTGASRTCAPSPRSSRASRSRQCVNAMIVPGSGIVKMQAEAEGLDQIFRAAGFDWREPGCSMCLAMNADRLAAAGALRLDLEPQLRGPPGLQGPHPPRLAGHGGGGRDRRAVRGYPRLALIAPSSRPERSGEPGSAPRRGAMGPG